MMNSLVKMIEINELKTAFRKLLALAYYDKNDMVLRHHVAQFAYSLSDQQQEEFVFTQIAQVANGSDDATLQQWLDQMALVYLPKKLAEDKNSEKNHLITNIPSQQAKIGRLIVRTDIPVELLIIDVAWVLKFGYKVDSILSSNSWGNRIDLIADNSAVRKGNSLFKRYHSQYKQWWQGGVEVANEHLKNRENVTIVNFDITNCYHSIDFDFEGFLADYEKSWPNDGIRGDSMTIVIQRIYERYWQLTQQSDADVYSGGNEGKQPMSLSLPSSHILANWYLQPLDEYIEKTYKPLYYGRYVDDCMVVMNTRSDAQQMKESVAQELPGLLEWKDETEVLFGFSRQDGGGETYHRLQTFTIQKDKLYVYRFDCELPQSSIEQFAEDQLDRSSEFRFFNDEEDAESTSLEFVTLINALDAEEEKGRRFSILEENRYKLNVYLAKLSQNLVKYGKGYSHYAEVDKVFSFFQGALLIKHYQIWERLMTVFVLGDKAQYADEFVQRVQEQIDRIEAEDGLFVKSKDNGDAGLKACLKFHLEQSYLMAKSLHRGDSGISTIYLDTFMVRSNYNNYPLQEFADAYHKDGVAISGSALNYNFQHTSYRWMPYYVKLYDVMCMYCIGQPYDPSTIDTAFAAYQRLNDNGMSTDYIKALFRHPKDDVVSEFNTWLDEEPCTKDNITVSVVNMDISTEEAGNQIKDFGKIDVGKAKLFMGILDQITKIGSTDIFLLPEMSLPYYELADYCRYSANREKAFVAGVEYVVKGNTVYNYIITCLPIVLYGQMDALPVIRLKNHYAPAEVEAIFGAKHLIPLNDKKWQNLYHWKNHVFTTYYCYELANIRDRSFFFSKIDAMYCPVFNPDTYYYNNIAESMSRDMHCFFVLSNVSHYGDSRVTQPTRHIEMNMMKVKGGNTKDNKAVVLSATLPVKELRDFQTMDDRSQTAFIDDKDNKKKKFKHTPPDYNRDSLKVRRSARFIYKADFTEEFLSRLYKDCMQYQKVRIIKKQNNLY